MFIRNAWYVAAWSDEVEAGRILSRTILGDPVVMYRTGDGALASLAGRCAHRRMPLAHAKVDGDRLTCCYHGLSYDASGACVRIPGQDRVPADLRIRCYPAVERYGAVWLWMGDADAADPNRIFECPRLGPNGEGGQKFYYHAAANYLYLNDNLSDLLHQAYLHNPSFGGNTDPLGETLPKVRQDGSRIHVEWDWLGVPVPGAFADAGGFQGLADGWNYSVFEPPSFYVNNPGFAEAGTGGFDSERPQGDGKASFTVYQLITPETERTTHFFKIVYCDWPAEILHKLTPLIDNVNREDIWACEEQQRMAELDPSAPMHAIPTDQPVVLMRRVLERLHAEERGPAAE